MDLQARPRDRQASAGASDPAARPRAPAPLRCDGAGARRALESLREAGHEGAVVPTIFRARCSWPSPAALGLGGPRGPFHEIEVQGKGIRVTAWIAQSRSSFARSTRHPIPGTLRPWPSTGPGVRPDAGRGPSSKAGGRLGAGTRPQSGAIGLEKHGKQWPWRGHDEVAHAIMLSGDWEAATTAWDSALKARHGPKRMALFYRSLTAHLAGDHERRCRLHHPHQLGWTR